MITVRRPSGLVVPIEPPELSCEAAIERSWTVPDGKTLLEPKRPEYLPAYPCPDLGYQRWPWEASPGWGAARIPWPDSVYDWGHAAIVPTY